MYTHTLPIEYKTFSTATGVGNFNIDISPKKESWYDGKRSNITKIFRVNKIH